MLDVKSVRSKALEALVAQFGKRDGAFVKSKRLIVPTDDPEFLVGFIVSCIRKYGQPLLDIFIKIYWIPFENVHREMSLDHGMDEKYLREWSASAFTIGIRSFSKDWKNGGEYLEDQRSLDVALDKAVFLIDRYGREYIDGLISVQGILSYLDGVDRFSPGTWRPTLEFLVRDRLFGPEAACTSLRAQVASTVYEKQQQDWLTARYCLPRLPSRRA